MTIKTKLEVNGVAFGDYRNLEVNKTMHDSNASSNFKVTFDSPFGRHGNSFKIGQEVIIYADETDATTKIFSGIVEKLQFRGKESTQTLTMSGRDYSLRLQDITAQPQVFNNTEVSSIVTQLLALNDVPDITTNNVNVTGTTLVRMSYSHESLFDAFTELATLSNSIFWIDEDKDLHWTERKSISTDIIIGDDQNNLLTSDLNRSREGMANVVWVYGDRYLSGFTENIPTTGNQQYTLLSRPHNTEISYQGSSLKGSIEDITITPTSGIDYTVDFFDRKINFQSGTDIGYSSIPAVGGSIIVNYQRELPIVKRSQDDTSIKFYGPKVKIIKDKSIKDPNTALDLVKATIADSNPLNRLNCKLKGWFTFNPGETVRFDLEDFGMDLLTMSIVSISYDFNKNSIQNNSTISVTLSKKLLDITDKVKELDRRLTSIESPDVSDTDVITRLFQSKEEVMVVGSRWNVYATTDLGSSFIFGKGYHGVTGPTFGGILGSVIISGINFLGDSRGPESLIFTGSNNYEVTGSYNPAGSEVPGGFGTLSSDYG